MYKRKIQLIKDLACEELEVEEKIMQKRGDKELKKIVSKICENCHLDNEDKCPLCNSKFEDCPDKETMKKEILKFYNQE